MTAELDYGFLSRDDCRALFENPVSGAPVALRSLPAAKLLGVNRRAMTGDPVFADLDGDVEAYKAHLLRSCAFALDGNGADLVTGWADRYGGAGIGNSGGSGRAAYVNGYHIKGVGRTPLAGRRADPSHATGAIFVAEAVADTVYAEAMRSFPWSTVPTLAIIDTGLYYDWDEAVAWSGAPVERKVLVVRPPFLRPAHFDRALALILEDKKAGGRDADRVVHIIKTVQAMAAPENLGDVFMRFWTRWAAQAAYGVVNGISQYNCSTSNVCLNGALVDFGGAREMIARETVVTTDILPHGVEFEAITSSVGRSHRALERYGDDISVDTGAARKVAASYNRAMVSALLAHSNIRLPEAALDDAAAILSRSGEFKARLRQMFLGRRKGEAHGVRNSELAALVARALCDPLRAVGLPVPADSDARLSMPIFGDGLDPNELLAGVRTVVPPDVAVCVDPAVLTAFIDARTGFRG